MDKSPDAFRTISEVAAWLDTPPHVLRFWETRFSQLKPIKRSGGRRYYRPSDIALLAGIRKLLHEDGLTTRGVQKILRERGVRHVAALGAAGGALLPPPAALAPAEAADLAEAAGAPMHEDAETDAGAAGTVVALGPGLAPPPEAGSAQAGPAAAAEDGVTPPPAAGAEADPWWAETPAMALRALRRRGGPADPAQRARLAALLPRIVALRARLEAGRSAPGRG